MGSNIYTRTGDRGTTSLSDGSRVPKESTRVEAYGTIDEANSWVGMAIEAVDDPLLTPVLLFVQHRFYNCSSNVAAPSGALPDRPGIAPLDIAFLESAIDRMEQETGPLTGFVLPAGERAACILHVARTVCRRAERRLLRLAREETVNEEILKFINRTSDLLFAAARYATVVQGSADILWNRDFPIPRILGV